MQEVKVGPIQITATPTPEKKSVVKAGTKVTKPDGKVHVFQEDTPMSDKALKYINKQANAKRMVEKKAAKGRGARRLAKASRKRNRK